METSLRIAWEVVNSPVGVTTVAGVVLWLLNKLYSKKPAWKEWEGTIISGIKRAEKIIPDDTDNKAAARFDAALRFVLAAYAAAKAKEATGAELQSLKEGIAIVHAGLESEEIL